MTDDDFIAGRPGADHTADHTDHTDYTSHADHRPPDPRNDHGDRWHFLAPDGPGATPAFSERVHLVSSVMVPASWRYEINHRYPRYGSDQRQLIAAAGDIALHLTFGPPDVIALPPSIVIDRVRIPTTTSINWLIAVARDRSGFGVSPAGPSRPRRRDGLEEYPDLARRFDQTCQRLNGSYASDIRSADHDLLRTLRALGLPAADQLDDLMRRWLRGRPDHRASEPWQP